MKNFHFSLETSKFSFAKTIEIASQSRTEFSVVNGHRHHVMHRPLLYGISALNRPILVVLYSSFLVSVVQGGVIFSTSYTAAEGFQNAPLRNNADWVGGGQVAVRPGTTGFVRNGNIQDQLPTYNVNGALPGGLSTGFSIGDQISIQTQLQFTLPGSSFAQEVARFGFSRSMGGPLEHGFGIVWDEGVSQPSEQSGFVRFFPDFDDYVLVDDIRPANVFNSFSIQGRFVGLNVNRPGGGDLRSNPFEIDYTAEKVSNDQWDVVDLSIRDLNSGANFFYDLNVQPIQSFNFDGGNAFFGQRMIVQGRGNSAAIATSEFVTYSFTSAQVPEPSTLCFALPGLGLAVLGRRSRRSNR